MFHFIFISLTYTDNGRHLFGPKFEIYHTEIRFYPFESLGTGSNQFSLGFSAVRWSSFVPLDLPSSRFTYISGGCYFHLLSSENDFLDNFFGSYDFPLE